MERALPRKTLLAGLVGTLVGTMLTACGGDGTAPTARPGAAAPSTRRACA